MQLASLKHGIWWNRVNNNRILKYPLLSILQIRKSRALWSQNSKVRRIIWNFSTMDFVFLLAKGVGIRLKIISVIIYPIFYMSTYVAWSKAVTRTKRSFKICSLFLNNNSVKRDCYPYLKLVHSNFKELHICTTVYFILML